MGSIYTEEEKYELAISRGIIVDEEDAWLLRRYSWQTVKTGHVRTGQPIDGKIKTIYLHHMIMGVPLFADEVIDHIDRNPLNNKRSNLRITTYRQNILNSDRFDIHGVSFDTTTNKYRVRISFGLYETIEEAIKIRDNILKLSNGMYSK